MQKPETQSNNPPGQRPTTNSPTGSDRVLPHSLEAERALLGSMLIEETAIAEAVSALQGADAPVFWSDRHQRVFDLIVELWRGGRPIDYVVLRDELAQRGVATPVGAFDLLTELVDSVASALRAREYADIVRKKFLLRQLIGAAQRVSDSAYSSSQTAEQILDFAEKTVLDVTERRVIGDGAMQLPAIIEEVFSKIQDLDGSMLTGEPTGYAELDELTCGLQPSELIIVAGRPSMGKTAFGLNIAEHMALTEDRPVLFFSLEMSRQQVAQRILCSRAQVDAQRLRRGSLGDREMQALQTTADMVRTKPLFIDDTSSLSVLELRARARMAHRRHKLRAIFVDYLQLMRSPGAESRQQEVAEISRGLKALAKDLHVPVIAMAQLNRNTEDRSGNRPRMSDLRESGAIEQDADVVSLLHRESYYKQGDDAAAAEDNRAELIIAKQRNGPVGTIELLFDRKHTRFMNLYTAANYANTPEAARPPTGEF